MPCPCIPHHENIPLSRTRKTPTSDTRERTRACVMAWRSHEYGYRCLRLRCTIHTSPYKLIPPLTASQPDQPTTTRVLNISIKASLSASGGHDHPTWSQTKYTHFRRDPSARSKTGPLCPLPVSPRSMLPPGRWSSSARSRFCTHPTSHRGVCEYTSRLRLPCVLGFWPSVMFLCAPDSQTSYAS